jgi:hypothetical protein
VKLRPDLTGATGADPATLTVGRGAAGVAKTVGRLRTRFWNRVEPKFRHYERIFSSIFSRLLSLIISSQQTIHHSILALKYSWPYH